MPTSAKVAIELYVDDQGTLRVREFRDEATKDLADVEKAGTSSAGKIQASWEKLKGAWVEITASILAMRQAWDMANMAAKAKQEQVAFANLAASYGSNGDKILAELKRVSAGTVDTMTLIEKAGTAMMMGISPDNIVKLMEIAKATTRTTGQTVEQAFGDISLAVARQSKMILDNLGIIISIQKANEEYAKSVGKTSAQLTSAEQKQAFMNAAMKAGIELMQRMGNQTNTASDSMQKWSSDWKNAVTWIGKVILTAELGIQAVVSYAGEAVSKTISLLADANYWAVKFASNLPVIGNWMNKHSDMAKKFKDAAAAQVENDLNQAKNSWQAMISLWEKADPIMTKVKNNAQAITQTLQKQQKILDKQKQAAQKQAAAEKEMYEQAGLGAERYFSQEATDLVKKAARWEAAGADTYKVEQWLYDQLGKLSDEAWKKGETAAGQAMDAMQAQSRILVDQFNAANTTIKQQLDAVGVKVQQLNGQNIGLTATFDGGAVVTGIDNLILKFQQLQAASAGAAAASQVAASSSGTPAPGSFENTDPNLSAEQVAAAETTYYAGNSGRQKSAVNVYINQKMSRSDVSNVITEQKRINARS